MEKKKKNTAPETAEKTEETDAPAVENTPTAEELLLAAQVELKEKEDKYLRLAAEYENFRRRTAAERTSLYAEAVGDAVKVLLPVLDDLERAAGYTEADKVAEGLAIIAKSAAAALSKLDVTAFGAAGDTFDPQMHNAVMHDEDPTMGESVITDVFQKGYKKGDKIIRYAMVKVVN